MVTSCMIEIFVMHEIISPYEMRMENTFARILPSLNAVVRACGSSSFTGAHMLSAGLEGKRMDGSFQAYPAQDSGVRTGGGGDA